MGHVRMMAAAQPFLSGAISKTVNLPEDATVDQIADVYMQSWKLGLKATAVYRDNCKVGQPLSDAKAKTDDKDSDVLVKAEPEVRYIERPKREKLPQSRVARTTSFKVGQAEGYITVGEYDDGRPGEVFIKMSKQGSTLGGVMDALSVTVSLGLQYGVPLETYVAKFVGQRFEPAGLTTDKDIRMAGSILDYIFKRLALDYLDADVRQMYGIFTTAERTAMVESGSYDTPVVTDEVVPEAKDEAAKAKADAVVAAALAAADEDLVAAREAAAADAPECSVCQTSVGMVRAGACWIHPECGTSTGCS
jgi:ribonucleoside-diphosphate reductase alpha chain